MCRAEAYQLYAKKLLFDAVGVQLYAVLHEHLEGMEFFKALGEGLLLKDKFISGFLLDPQAIANYRHEKAFGVDHNFKGERETKGGLFSVGRGKGGIASQFIERNFGD